MWNNKIKIIMKYFLKIDHASAVVAIWKQFDISVFIWFINDLYSISIRFIRVGLDINFLFGKPLSIISFRTGFSIIEKGIPALTIKRCKRWSKVPKI